MISSQPRDRARFPALRAVAGGKERRIVECFGFKRPFLEGHLVQGPWHEQGHLAVTRLLGITHSLRSHLCERTRTPLTRITVPAGSQIPLPAQDCPKEPRGQFCVVLSLSLKKKITILVCSLFLKKSKRSRTHPWRCTSTTSSELLLPSALRQTHQRPWHGIYPVKSSSPLLAPSNKIY